MSKTEKDMIAEMFSITEEKPAQYRIGIDTFERARANMTAEQYLACIRFNIDKYNWREKNQDIEDLEKIIAYANEGLKFLTGEYK